MVAEQISGDDGSGADEFMVACGQPGEGRGRVGTADAGDEERGVEFGIGGAGEGDKPGDERAGGGAEDVAGIEGEAASVLRSERMKIKTLFVAGEPGSEQAARPGIFPNEPFADERQGRRAEEAESMAGLVAVFGDGVIEQAQPDIERRAVASGAGHKAVMLHSGDEGGDNGEDAQPANVSAKGHLSPARQ